MDLARAERRVAGRGEGAGRAPRRRGKTLPLYGLPFAVKDNIDVAGLPTTCACPDFAYAPEHSAPVVERLRRAGALCVGKTNLDQFATGLVGVRSPYGVPRNPFDAAYIPGGSSSGSAVAVATGLVAFALGTDTAGSGRVPASFNNIVGLKPTRGLISAAGVVPACRSLDCVSVFALTVEDAAAVVKIAHGFDPSDGYSRAAPAGFAPMGRAPERFAFGVLSASERELFGNADGPALYAAAIERLKALGGEAVEIDYAPFLEVNKLLYRGPWLAERCGSIKDAIGTRHEVLHPVLRRIVAGGEGISGPDAFAGLHRLMELRQASAPVWRDIDLLLLPTTGTTHRIAEIEAEPIALNANLGRYTNFCNLLDLSAIAIPTGFRADGLPFGVTLFAPAFHDPLLAAIGGALHKAAGLPLGATGQQPHPDEPTAHARTGFPYVTVAVVRGAFVGPADEPRAGGARRAAAPGDAHRVGLPALRLAGRQAARAGAPAGRGDRDRDRGVGISPSAALGTFADGIAAPLGLGKIKLDDCGEVTGFLCEAHAVDGARDISLSSARLARLARGVRLSRLSRCSAAPRRCR